MRKTALLLLLIIFSLACEKKVDLVVHNARVYTSDDNYTNISSFVVDEGRFIEVGGEELVEKYNKKLSKSLATLWFDLQEWKSDRICGGLDLESASDADLCWFRKSNSRGIIKR